MNELCPYGSKRVIWSLRRRADANSARQPANDTARLSPMTNMLDYGGILCYNEINKKTQ